MDVQPVQIVDGVQNGINGLGLGDEPDHAGVQVEIHQQDLLVLPAQLRGHVADQRGGAAAALGGEEGEALAAALGARSRRRLRSAERFSSALLSGSCSGGNRYSLIPARSAARIGSASALVFRAMIMGSPTAPRMEATSPSSGSFQLLISISTTSGRMRSSRSRKLVTSPMSWCSTMTRNGSSERPPAPVPTVPGFRSPVQWSADTC